MRNLRLLFTPMPQEVPERAWATAASGSSLPCLPVRGAWGHHRRSHAVRHRRLGCAGIRDRRALRGGSERGAHHRENLRPLALLNRHVHSVMHPEYLGIVLRREVVRVQVQLLEAIRRLLRVDKRDPVLAVRGESVLLLCLLLVPAEPEDLRPHKAAEDGQEAAPVPLVGDSATVVNLPDDVEQSLPGDRLARV